MYQRDYIMRLIEQLGKTMGVLLGLKQRKEPEAFETAIDEGFKRLFGLSGSLLRGLSERDLIELLTREGEHERLVACAALLAEDGDRCAMSGKSSESWLRWRKALRLYLHASRLEVTLEGFDADEEVERLLPLVPEQELPFETRRELWSWYERQGRYADAEDLLFAMLEELTGQEDLADRVPPADTSDHVERMVLKANPDLTAALATEGLAFYERLSALPDEQLDAGRLPRDEHSEAVRQLSQLLERLDRLDRLDRRGIRTPDQSIS